VTAQRGGGTGRRTGVELTLPLINQQDDHALPRQGADREASWQQATHRRAYNSYPLTARGDPLDRAYIGTQILSSASVEDRVTHSENLPRDSLTARPSRDTDIRNSVGMSASATEQQNNLAPHRRGAVRRSTAHQHVDQVMVARDPMVSFSRDSLVADLEVEPLVDRTSARHGRLSSIVTHRNDDATVPAMAPSQDANARHVAGVAPSEEPDDQSRSVTGVGVTIPSRSPVALSADALPEAEREVEEHFNELGRTSFLENIPVDVRTPRRTQRGHRIIATGAEHASGPRSTLHARNVGRRARDWHNAS
jgi:hypothetical protein